MALKFFTYVCIFNTYLPISRFVYSKNSLFFKVNKLSSEYSGIKYRMCLSLVVTAHFTPGQHLQHHQDLMKFESSHCPCYSKATKVWCANQMAVMASKMVAVIISAF